MTKAIVAPAPFAAIALAAGLAVTGCGGDGDDQADAAQAKQQQAAAQDARAADAAQRVETYLDERRETWPGCIGVRWSTMSSPRTES